MRHAVRSVLCLLAALLAFAPLASFAQTASFNLPAQPLAESLKALGAQANLNVMVSPALVDGKQAPALKAKLSVSDALARLLNGTGLEYHFVNDQTVVIREKGVVAVKDPPVGQVTNTDGQDSTKEAGKKSSQDFRVAQVDPGKTSGDVSVETSSRQESKQRQFVLEEVVVTGSRIPVVATAGPQDVKIYTLEMIEQSGQTTVTDFLNTLPDVSISINENGFQTFQGSTTIQLHGLPLGTTLILINGRRVQSSGGTFGTFFDLNSIPLVAVDRIEVVSEGSSAIYGSDAIAGVVNIILKKDLSGFEASGKYGAADGFDEWDGSLAWGAHWDKGSLSIIGSVQTRRELSGSERALTGNQDYRAYGGINARSNTCNPGNVFSVDGSNLPGVGAPFAGVPAGFTGIPTQQEFARTAGTLNACSLNSYVSVIPATTRQGVLAQGNYEPNSSVELFAELMASHVREALEGSPPSLFGIPGFQAYTVSVENPYNPFNQTVGVGYLLTDLGRSAQPSDTNFFRPLIGGRGTLLSTWKWELSLWDSFDQSHFAIKNNLDPTAVQNALNASDPATALNPFTTGSPGSAQLLRSLLAPDQTIHFYGQTLAANGFVHGPLLQLPSGSVEGVLGAEYDRDRLDINYINAPAFEPPNTESNHTRNRYAFFAEARVPILANRSHPVAGDVLALTLAGRYDHYSDFGNKTTPQVGVEWRPSDTFLIRGAYSRAFRAPDLYFLYLPVSGFPTTVVDPRNGNQLETITEVSGGNTKLQAETGQSWTFGLVYSSKAIEGLRVSVAHWKVEESDSIQTLPLQVLVDNEDLFPGSVIRNAAGVITQVNATYLNFGKIDVAGLDYQISYRAVTNFGEFSPSLAATQTYRYRAALTPATPPIDATGRAQDSGNWAPRWKGIASIGWKRGPYSLYAAGRYVGRYTDYDSTSEIGNFWLYDANFRCAIGQVLTPTSPWSKGAYLELGGINLFNRAPQYSNYFFGSVGYDPAQSDIRGRFLYAQLGVKW